MELGEPDALGRRSPVPVKGSEFQMKADAVICATATAQSLIPMTTPG